MNVAPRSVSMALPMILGKANEGCAVSRVLNAKISLEATLVGWIFVETKDRSFVQPAGIIRQKVLKAAIFFAP